MFKFLTQIKDKLLLGLIVVLAVAVLWQFYRATTAEGQLRTVEADLKIVNQSLDAAINTNAANLAVIDQLQIEKRLIDASLRNLEEARKRDQVVIGNLSASIKEQSKNPENRVPLSPVIKDTVGKIQAERSKREAPAK